MDLPGLNLERASRNAWKIETHVHMRCAVDGIIVGTTAARETVGTHCAWLTATEAVNMTRNTQYRI